MENTVTPWGPTGYVTYKRTYARRINDEEQNGATEEFPQTIKRVLDACQSQLGCGFSEEERQEFGKYLLALKGSVAGRFLWQLGTATVEKLGLMSLQNCALTVINDPVEPFIWAFDALMLGSGVGYNLQKEHVHEIPKVKYKVTLTRKDTKDADFIVPDTREGWIELLRKVLKYHFSSGFSFSYSTICIRGKGSPIKGFGGTASGPEELCTGIEQINELLNSRVGKKLRPIDVLDIMNIIGSIVVAGNVRRSAQIAIGDAEDLQFLSAKRWDKGNVPNWRAMSNNSVVCNDINYLPEQFWNGYDGKGEPYGLINLKLARSCGRLGEAEYPDPDVQGFNPCGEQSLNNYETCCLSEVFLPNVESYDELCRLLRYLYIVNKHSLRLKCHQEKTNDIVHKNMRMGIGVTGYLQSSEEQKGWLKPAYGWLRNLDKEYSAEQGWPTSIKLTTCKPSGTMALLPGVTPGVHPGFAHYFIRRIRMASNQPIVDICRNNGYPVEYQKNFDGTADRNTVVVSFPSSYPESTVVAKDLTAVQQLEYVKRLQTEWSDNAVSCTVYYKKDELPSVKEWLLKNYNDSIKSVSFLLHSDHGFAQAPYEEITKDQYVTLVKKVKPLTAVSFNQEELDNSGCETGHCPIR